MGDIADIRPVRGKGNIRDIPCCQNLYHRIAAVVAAEQAVLGSNVQEIAIEAMETDAGHMGFGEPPACPDHIPGLPAVHAAIGAAQVTASDDDARRPGPNRAERPSTPWIGPHPLVQLGRRQQGCENERKQNEGVFHTSEVSISWSKTWGDSVRGKDEGV